MSVNSKHSVGIKFYSANSYESIKELVDDFEQKEIMFQSIKFGSLDDKTSLTQIDMLEDRISLIKSTKQIVISFVIKNEDKKIGSFELRSSYWKSGSWHTEYSLYDILDLNPTRLTVNKILKANGLGFGFLKYVYLYSGALSALLFILSLVVNSNIEGPGNVWILNAIILSWLTTLFIWIVSLNIPTFTSTNRVLQWIKVNFTQIILSIGSAVLGFVLGYIFT